MVAVGRRRTVRHPTALTVGNAPAGCHGYSAIVIATTGVFLAAVFSAGAYLFTAGWLHTGSLKPGFHAMSLVPTTFELPEAIKLAALAYILSMIGLAVVLVFAAVWFLTARRRTWHGLVDLSEFAVDYPDLDPHDPLVAKRRQEILRAFFLGRLVDIAGGPLLVLVGMGAAISGAIGVMLFGEHVGHWGWAERSGRWLAESHTSTQASLQSSIPGLEVVGGLPDRADAAAHGHPRRPGVPGAGHPPLGRHPVGHRLVLAAHRSSAGRALLRRAHRPRPDHPDRVLPLRTPAPAPAWSWPATARARSSAPPR